MDDEDGCSSGLSGWAWHELGREAERSDQSQERLLSTLAARLRGEVPVNIGGLLANNQALWHQNQQLWHQNQVQQQRINDLQVEMQGRWEDLCRIRNWAHSEIYRLKLENATLRDSLGE